MDVYRDVPVVRGQAGARVSDDTYSHDFERYLRAIPHADGVVHYRRGHRGYGAKLCDYMGGFGLYPQRGPYRDVRGFPTCLWCMRWRLEL